MYKKFCAIVTGFPAEKDLKPYTPAFLKCVLIALAEAVYPVFSWKRTVDSRVAIEEMVGDYYSCIACVLVGMHDVDSLGVSACASLTGVKMGLVYISIIHFIVSVSLRLIFIKHIL